MIASIRCPKLVGRAEETALLRARLGRADLGFGSLTFISGDAGIGKTLTIRIAIHAARRANALVRLAGG